MIRPDRSWFDVLTLLFSIGVLIILAYSLRAGGTAVTQSDVTKLSTARPAGGDAVHQ